MFFYISIYVQYFKINYFCCILLKSHSFNLKFDLQFTDQSKKNCKKFSETFPTKKFKFA